jgi:hypothetical protein
VIKSGEYEFRVSSYLSVRFEGPAVIQLPPGLVHWMRYETLAECDLEGFEGERANCAWSIARNLYSDPEDLDTADEPGQGEA